MSKLLFLLIILCILIQTSCCDDQSSRLQVFSSCGSKCTKLIPKIIIFNQCYHSYQRSLCSCWFIHWNQLLNTFSIVFKESFKFEWNRTNVNKNKMTSISNRYRKCWHFVYLQNRIYVQKSTHLVSKTERWKYIYYMRSESISGHKFMILSDEMWETG